MDFIIKHFEKVDSTNTVLEKLLTSQTREGLVVTADRQTAGKGRLGRTWISEKGNLFCSLYAQPQQPSHMAVLLTYVASLAVALGCECFLPKDISPTVKWPNDVCIQGKKVAGLLLEAVCCEEKSGVIIGIGVNINHAPHVPGRTVTSLGEWADRPLDVTLVLQEILGQFSRLYTEWQRDGFERIRQMWMQRHLYTANICVHQGNQQYVGEFSHIAEDGALVMRLAHTGQMQTIYSGECKDTE